MLTESAGRAIGYFPRFARGAAPAGQDLLTTVGEQQCQEDCDLQANQDQVHGCSFDPGALVHNI